MPFDVPLEQGYSTLRSNVDTAHIRREMLNNVEHLVVPIVALVEGVLQGANAQAPELALASEFAKFPQSWNGRPVTLNHPQRDGNFISANASPEVYSEETLGFLFNSRLDGKKLKTDAWINLNTVANADQTVQDEIARLERGEIVEVSTGLFTMSEAQSGKYNNKPYKAIWRDVVSDHLAILPLGITGACSVADGCGARVNMRVNCACQDVQEDDHEEPIVNKDDENVSLERNRFLRGLKDKFAGVFKLLNNAAVELSDMDTRAAIVSALKTEDADRWYDVVAVFDAYFIYAPGWDGSLFSRSYTISSDGTVDIGESRTRVRPETTFVPVKTTEEIKMNKKEKVDALIANSATQFAESDRATLEGMDESLLDKLAPVVNTEGTDNGQSSTTTTTPAPTVKEVTEPNAAPKANASLTAEEFLAQAPAEIKGVLAEGLRMQRDRKDALVKGLLANSRNSFDEAELRAMESSQLEKMAKIANVPDFSGIAGAPVLVANAADNAVPAAPKLFPSKTA